MNEVIKAILERRSIRKFKADEVPEELVNQVMEAGLYAANGMGKQCPIIIAIGNKELQDKFRRVNAEIMGGKADPFYGAPMILVVLAKKDRPTHDYDGALVLGNMMLAAHSLGLGSIWIHRAKEEFEMDEFKAILTDQLGLEDEYVGIGHLALGYADVKPEAAPRNENRAFWIE